MKVSFANPVRTVRVLYADGAVETVDSLSGDPSDTLKLLQDSVGGYIETYPIEPLESLYPPEVPLVIVFDEEGRLKNKSLNTEASRLVPFNLFGTAVICPRHYLD